MASFYEKAMVTVATVSPNEIVFQAVQFEGNEMDGRCLVLDPGGVELTGVAITPRVMFYCYISYYFFLLKTKLL